MNSEIGWADPERILTEPRVGRFAGGLHYLYVEQKHMAESEVGLYTSGLVSKVMEAYLQGRKGLELPTMLTMFLDLPGEEGIYDVQIGYAFHEEVAPRGEAQVRYVEPSLCASMVVWGTFDDVTKSYVPLLEFITAEGLKHVEGGQEWYLYWEGDESRNNVRLVQYMLEG